MSVQTDYYIPQMKIKDETISQMAAEITKLRAERDDAARDMRERCARLIQSGAGMADLIDQQELDQQAEYILRLPLPLSVIATQRDTP